MSLACARATGSCAGVHLTTVGVEEQQARSSHCESQRDDLREVSAFETGCSDVVVMTDYWVSQGKHWCDMCKCWMNDTPSARANHEKGSGHKMNVQRKLREMRLKAESEKKEEADTKKQLDHIELAAERAYQKDLAKLVCTL
jgi:U1 zinc finger